MLFGCKKLSVLSVRWPIWSQLIAERYNSKDFLLKDLQGRLKSEIMFYLKMQSVTFASISSSLFES